MGRYLGKCKGVVGEIAVVGVRTKPRDAQAMAVPSSPGEKIRKTTAGTTPYDVDKLKSRRHQRLAMMPEQNSASSTSCRPEMLSSSSDSAVVLLPANCFSAEISSDRPASCSSSNDASISCELVKDRLEIVADPEVESALTSSKVIDCRSTASRENYIGALKSDDLDSPTKNSGTKSTVKIVKMPSDSEIDEFFAAAEKDIHKRFIEKYNFDIVKYVPLEGRYEWLPIKP